VYANEAEISLKLFQRFSFISECATGLTDFGRLSHSSLPLSSFSLSLSLSWHVVGYVQQQLTMMRLVKCARRVRMTTSALSPVLHMRVPVDQCVRLRLLTQRHSPCSSVLYSLALNLYVKFS